MSSDSGAAIPRNQRFPRIAIGSWAMYDFANTIFSYAVLTEYFNTWIINDLNRPDWNVGLMTTIVSILLILTMPGIGAVADQTGRRERYVFGFTALCLLGTMYLGIVDGAIPAMFVAGFAIFCFQSALSHYDPLLASVAPPESRGRISGLGVGLGYVGVLFGLAVLAKIVGSGDNQDAFVPTAIMYGVFSIPLFLFVRDTSDPALRTSSALSSAYGVLRGANAQLAQTIRNMREPENRHVARFLIARFLYADALLVVISYMSVYMVRLGGFSSDERRQVLGLSIVCAVFGAFIAGLLINRVGPKRILIAIISTFAGALVLASATGSQQLLWILGPIVGIGLGGVWTADRVFMLRLSPPKVRGEFFGLYNAVGKASSAFGPLVIWGGCTYLFHEVLGTTTVGANRVALAVLAVSALTGAWLIRSLDDSEEHSMENEEVVAGDDQLVGAGAES